MASGMPFCADEGEWRDVTEAECQQLSVCAKGKRLLGQARFVLVYL